MKLKRYYILGDSLRDSMYCFDYMRNLLRDHIRFTDKNWRIIDIDDYRLIFASDEQYYRNLMHGDHDVEVISCYYVERMLDTYRTLAQI